MQTNTHYFTNCLTLAALTKERNRLARIHHPDVGGSVEVMQQINAQFDEAKRRLSAPVAERVWVRPQERPAWQDIDDVLERMKGWAREKEATRQEAERKAYRDQVDKQRAKFAEDLASTYWDMHMAERRQGMFRGCQVQYKAGEFLYVGGNTYHYRQWFKEHGFRWNPDKKQWHFFKKPLFNPDTDEEDDDDDDD